MVDFDDRDYWLRESLTPVVLVRDSVGALFVFGAWAVAGDIAFSRALFADVARDRAPGAARTRALFGASFALALGLATLVLCEIAGVLHPLSRWACWEVGASLPDRSSVVL